MPSDLHHFLFRFVSTVALSLIPVALVAVMSMPSTLHHHMGGGAVVAHAFPLHMT